MGFACKIMENYVLQNKIKLATSILKELTNENLLDNSLDELLKDSVGKLKNVASILLKKRKDKHSILDTCGIYEERLKKSKLNYSHYKDIQKLLQSDEYIYSSTTDKDTTVEKDITNIEVQVDQSEINYADRVIKKTLSCYVCKTKYNQIHHFYNSMCLVCGDFNYVKRFIKCNLNGYIAIVTGARIKIGYETGLSLLRCGATLIATSRFIEDMFFRYSKEPDFESFKTRLYVYAVDLRFINQIEIFIDWVKLNFTSIDILINNACQTIKRLPKFYEHLLEESKVTRQLLLKNLPTVNTTYPPTKNKIHKLSSELPSNLLLSREISDDSANVFNLDNCIIKQKTDKYDNIINLSDHVMSCTQIVDGSTNEDASKFPVNTFDKDHQQVDLSDKNSWVLGLDEVSPIEIVEVHVINAIAPSILCGKLKPLLKKSAETKGKSFIVNVSSMEGQFYRHKSSDHCHTNMSKSSINMMVRTSANDYVLNNICMNAVDTGWVTLEMPHSFIETPENKYWQPPLDEIDGAMRVLDPIYTSINENKIIFGKFLKDYVPTLW